VISKNLKKISNITGGLLLILVILLCIPLTIPRLFGCQIYHVISGSMEPAIPTGSVVYVKEVEADTIETNDVIAFYSDTDSGAIITHRVVSNRIVSGEFVTKGDANDAEDVTPVSYDRLLGKVVLSVPYLGAALALVATTKGKISVGCLIIAAVILMVLGRKES
jgi:signal peptidase I